MQLTPKSAFSLSLAIYELATNAATNGALTAPGGRVAVVWRSATGGGVELPWTETGGPPVEQPKRRGFGSALIERALSMETGGHAVVHLHADRGRMRHLSPRILGDVLRG